MFGDWVGRSEQQDLGLPIDQYIVLDAVSFFLATIVLSLFFRVFGALNRSFGTILKEKLSFCGSKLQFRDAACRSLAQFYQGLAQTRMQNMNTSLSSMLTRGLLRYST